MNLQLSQVLNCSDPGPCKTTSVLSAPGSLSLKALALPVLVIEDETMIAWMLESMLEDLGFQAITVTATGEQAIKEAALTSPSLIISDINLGSDCLDGIGTVADILTKSHPSVIFVSGYVGEENLARIQRQAPGAHVLRKPLSIDELRRTIIAAMDQVEPH